MTLTHVDLFSGIGGFALASRWNGIETVQFVEIDPFCCKVLEKNFPGVPIHHDIKTFTNAECNRCNGETVSIQPRETRQGCTLSSGRNSRPFILTGGFPCQPFSCAGKRKGTSDDRYLWPHMLRVIQELRPRWVIAENVSGLVNIKNVVEQGSDADMEDEVIDGGEGGVSTSTLVSILSDLEQSGYSVQVYIVPACALGAPHRRDRVWILGRRKDADDSKSGGCGILYSEDIGETSTQVNASAMPDRHARNSEGVPNRLDAPEHEGREDDPGRLKQDAPDTGAADVCGRCDRGDTDSDRVETSQPPRSEPRGECARCYKDGWSENWPEVAARLCRMDDGVSEELYKLETSDRVARLKALGNAIVPQVAAELMRAILEADP